MDTKTCPKCQAKWFDGQHYWATGKLGNESDLAGLVCDQYSDNTCINPIKGTKHDGDTWEKRASDLEVLTEKMKDQLGE